jgi:hypothetical protein
MIAKEYSTLFTGLWKAGKSTLLGHVLRAFANGGNVGGEVFPARALVVSEEAAGHWARRRDELELGDHVEVLARPFKGNCSKKDWPEFARQLGHLIKQRRYDVVIIDTIAAIWPVEDENQAPAVVNSLGYLGHVLDAGAALLNAHHPSKRQDSNVSNSARGSGAILAWHDIITELRRFDDKDMSDRRRRLAGLGRFVEIPHDITVELSEDGLQYRTIGETTKAKTLDHLSELKAILTPTDWLTAETIHLRWKNTSDKDLGIRTIRRQLEKGVSEGLWQRQGAGTKGDPHVYRDGTPEVMTFTF